MEVRNDISYRSQSYKPAFGAINYESAEETLRKVFSLEELNKFKKLVNENKIYTNCDLILFGEGKNLHGRIADTTDLKDGCKSVEVSPWFFENKYKWIK
jgi:hypothetical protein